MSDIGPFLAGFGFCALLALALEIRPPRRRSLRGNYRDGRAPFAIVAPRPDSDYVRSEELIARTARRLMNIRSQRDSAASEGGALRRDGRGA